MDKVLLGAEIIPLNSEVLEKAGDYQEGLGLPANDSIVFASVMSHLEEKFGEESCFLNRNTKDFDSPQIREMLRICDCKFFGSFDDGLHYIRSRLKPS